MAEMFELECGCKFPILDYDKEDIDGLPSIEIDYENIRLDCPIAWEVLAEGKTKGVFQLETQLGASWSKKVQPVDIEELAAVISIIRPGTLKAILDGKSMTQHFVDRKNGAESYQDIDPSISEFLEPTYGVMVYQEQSMKIAEKLASFDLKQADDLRKAIGKKLADLMAKVKINFMEGCKKAGIVTDEQAEEIFDVIEKSNRYAFNKSHAVGYGLAGYWTAYAKAHFPLHFFCSWLGNARNKADFKEEVEELISDAKQFKVSIGSPSIVEGNKNFKIVNNRIVTGIGNVKGLGESVALEVINKLAEVQKTYGKAIKDFNWLETLLILGNELKKTAFLNLIAVGALSHLGIYRKRMMFEYNKLLLLTGKYEIPWLIENLGKYKTLGEGIALLAKSDAVTKGRKEKVDSIAMTLLDKSFTTVDDEEWVASIEAELIGAPISCSKLDACDTSCGDTKCSEFQGVPSTKNISIACEIARVSPYTPNGGKTMFFITLRDSTGSVEAVMYSDKIADYENLMFKGNTICATGRKSNKGSLAISRVDQI